MGRPRQPLKATYGQLTVLEELANSMVKVRCSCGTERTVNRSNLRSGKVTTCGAGTCRPVRTRTARRNRGPSWINRDAIEDLWLDYNGGIRTAEELAEHYVVHPQSVYRLTKQIEDAGGIEAYMDSLTPEKDGPKAQAPARYEPPPEAPPPAQWIPKGRQA